MDKSRYHCGRFDFDGFATDNFVYPPEWKAAMFFISCGFVILSLTVLLTLITCCRQSIIGKSIHTITGSAQMISGKMCEPFSADRLLNWWCWFCCCEKIRNIGDDRNIFAPVGMGSSTRDEIVWTGFGSILSGRMQYRWVVLIYIFGFCFWHWHLNGK